MISYWVISVLIVFSVATTSLFALIVLILSGLVTNYSRGFLPFASLGIATALFTLLSLPAMFVYNAPFSENEIFFLTVTLPVSRLALSMVRKGAFSSMIALEIGWTCKSHLVFHIDIQYDLFLFSSKIRVPLDHVARCWWRFCK